MKITLTNSAKKEIEKAISKIKGNSVPRVFLTGCGWSGPSFGLALDEPMDNDLIIQIEGITLAIEAKAAEEYNVLTIDFTNNWMRRGFSISPYGVKYSE